MKKQPKKPSLETDLQKAIEEHLRLVDAHSDLIKQLEERFEAERLSKEAKIAERCNICPYRSECKYLSYSLTDRKAMCVFMRFPLEYSGELIIPESHQIWKTRLLNFVLSHQQ